MVLYKNLAKIKYNLGLDFGNEPNFNNVDLCGLSAPKVPLKKLRATPRHLLYSAVKLRAVSH
jgi:hypothetical protein